MPFNLNEIIKGVENNKPRILLYAMPKVGKTTFASKFPNHLIINVDGSAERVDCTRTPRITNTTDFFDVLSSLYNDDHKYSTLVIDTVDWLEKLICDEVARQQGKKTVEDISYGKGYPLVVQRWREILEALEELRLVKNMTILMLSHAGIRHHAPPMGDDYDIYAPRLYGKAEKTETTLALMLEFTDIIAFAHHKVLTKETGDGFSKRTQPVGVTQSMLYTSANNPCYIAGNRFGLKEEMPFSYQEFAADFKEKTAYLNKKETKEVKKDV